MGAERSQQPPYKASFRFVLNAREIWIFSTYGDVCGTTPVLLQNTLVT